MACNVRVQAKAENEGGCMGKVLAMILAGGRGRRMDILCHERPKPALPFAGRFRIIDFSLSNCAHSEINSVVVLCPKCKTFETLCITSGRLNKTQKFRQEDGGIYHDCSSNRPCLLLPSFLEGGLTS